MPAADAAPRGDDLARAVAHALERELPSGFHAVYVAAPDNGTDVPTRELAERYHPQAKLAADIPEYGSLISSRGAAELLGVRPTTLASRMKRMGLAKPTS